MEWDEREGGSRVCRGELGYIDGEVYKTAL